MKKAELKQRLIDLVVAAGAIGAEQSLCQQFEESPLDDNSGGDLCIYATMGKLRAFGRALSAAIAALA